MTSQPWLGWALILFALAVLTTVVVWFFRYNRGYSKSSTRVYFGSLIGMAVVALGAGAIAGASEENVFVAYGAVMVIGGTAGQILLAVSRKNGKPLLGTHKTVDVVVQTKPEGDAAVFPIPIGDDELRDTLHVVVWALIFIGAIGALVGAFA